MVMGFYLKALTPLNQMKFQMILSERFMKSTVISHQYYRIIMKSLVKSVKSCKCCKNFTGKWVKYTWFQINMPTLLSSNANVWNFSCITERHTGERCQALGIARSYVRSLSHWKQIGIENDWEKISDHFHRYSFDIWFGRLMLTGLWNPVALKPLNQNEISNDLFRADYEIRSKVKPIL